MKTSLIIISIVAILAALAYLIIQASKPEKQTVIEVTTPAPTLVQPVYAVRKSGNGHHHNGNGNAA